MPGCRSVAADSAAELAELSVFPSLAQPADGPWEIVHRAEPPHRRLTGRGDRSEHRQGHGKEYQMTTIRIERVTDHHDCETCGCSLAGGARVYFDGELGS